MKNLCYGWAIGILAACGAAGQIQSGPASLDGPFQVRYASNLTTSDSVINITNTGANGNNLFGPGYGHPAGNICANVYTFSPDEQLISCCSCLVTPNGLVHLTANNDLISNTLTGIKPDSIVIKLVGTSTGSEIHHHDDGTDTNAASFSGSNCTNSAALAGGNRFQLASGMLAWGTSSRSCSTGPGVPPPTLNLPAGQVTTEVTFSHSLNLPSFLTVTFPGLPAGFDVTSAQTYLAWCANFMATIPVFPTPNPDIFTSIQLYNLFNTYGSLPGNAQSANWDNVNYLLNHKGSASVAAVQEAIWFLLNGSYFPNQFIPVVPPPGADALVADALANGNGFVPAAGQKIAVLLDSSGLSGTGLQDIIIEVTVPSRSCENLTETSFLPATLSDSELKSITNRCANITGNGSTFGQCSSCRIGGLGGSKL